MLKTYISRILKDCKSHDTNRQCNGMHVPSKDLIANVTWTVFMFNELKWEMIVLFVDIDRIVDYHCLNFLFIMADETLYRKLKIGQH